MFDVIEIVGGQQGAAYPEPRMLRLCADVEGHRRRPRPFARDRRALV